MARRMVSVEESHAEGRSLGYRASFLSVQNPREGSGFFAENSHSWWKNVGLTVEFVSCLDL